MLPFRNGTLEPRLLLRTSLRLLLRAPPRLLLTLRLLRLLVVRFLRVRSIPRAALSRTTSSRTGIADLQEGFHPGGKFEAVHLTGRRVWRWLLFSALVLWVVSVGRLGGSKVSGISRVTTDAWKLGMSTRF